MRTTLNEKELQSLETWGPPPVFEGGSKEDLELWLDTIRAACNECVIPKRLFPFVGLHYLGEGPKEYMSKCKRSHQEIVATFVWNWKVFKKDIRAMPPRDPIATEARDQEKDLPGNTPGTADGHHRTALAVAGTALFATGAAVLLAPVALPLIGFGAAGPIAGSLAAAIQSSVYGGAVASGSLFAMGQSLGMVGVPAAAQAAAVGATSAGSWLGWKATRR